MTGGQPALMGAHQRAAPHRARGRRRAACRLDRLFDYEIADKLPADDAVVGARVQVRFSGQQQRGWIVELAEESDVETLACRSARSSGANPS